jgi:hypothetical protein
LSATAVDRDAGAQRTSVGSTAAVRAARSGATMKDITLADGSVATSGLPRVANR